MLNDPCVGELNYEATTAAIFMGGLFLSFLVDYISKRFLLSRQTKRTSPDAETAALPSDDRKTVSPSGSAVIPAHGHTENVDLHSEGDAKLNVLVLETGIIFHSLRTSRLPTRLTVSKLTYLVIGLTLVVSGDSFFITLFIVILFHQMFEGLALGTCIAALPASVASTLTKLAMGTGFALITPVGMAIGIGVLDKFNGSDAATRIAIGTLDAFSAGILAWVGIHEMLARDWLHGSLVTAGVVKTGVAMFSLVAGMAVMSLLGKWA